MDLRVEDARSQGGMLSRICNFLNPTFSTPRNEAHHYRKWAKRAIGASVVAVAAAATLLALSIISLTGGILIVAPVLAITAYLCFCSWRAEKKHAVALADGQLQGSSQINFTPNIINPKDPVSVL